MAVEYKDVMTAKEVSKYLSLHINTIYKMIDKGTLPAWKSRDVGGIWLVDMKSYLESRRN